MKKVTVELVLNDKFLEVQAEEYTDTILNNTWAIHKEIDLNGEPTTRRSYVISDIKSGMSAFIGKSKADVINKLNKFMTKNIKYMKSILDRAKTVAERKELRARREELIQLFESKTGITLRINKRGVVDVVKLDKDLETPDGVSTSDFLKNKFGEDISKTLDDLIELQFV